MYIPESMEKQPLIILAGPTASGKTALSIALAKAVDGEIISADSMQVYQYMDIGSAKIKPEEMQGVKHYLIDELLPDEEFHVAKFKEYAKQYIQQIRAKGKLPILVGGTGFYIQAVLYGIDFTEGQSDSGLRRQLECFAKRYGAEALHQRLAAVDPQAAEEIHPNNIKRVIRAIEFFTQTGQRISLHNKRERTKKPLYNSAFFVLNDDRQLLYERIDRRVDAMMEEGLLDEVKRLRKMGYTKDLVSMQGLGYKELFAVLEGTCTIEEAVGIIKRDTRHFAKRQLTWFKREKDIIWLNRQELGDEANILAYMLRILREKGMINGETMQL